MIMRGLDINYKVNICFYKLKNSLYNILAFNKVAINPICNY